MVYPPVLVGLMVHMDLLSTVASKVVEVERGGVVSLVAILPFFVLVIIIVVTHGLILGFCHVIPSSGDRVCSEIGLSLAVVIPALRRPTCLRDVPDSV